MTKQNIQEITKQVDKQLEILSLRKIDMTCEEVEKTIRKNGKKRV